VAALVALDGTEARSPARAGNRHFSPLITLSVTVEIPDTCRLSAQVTIPPWAFALASTALCGGVGHGCNSAVNLGSIQQPYKYGPINN
jgi:hypothetical protein